MIRTVLSGMKNTGCCVHSKEEVSVPMEQSGTAAWKRWYTSKFLMAI